MVVSEQSIWLSSKTSSTRTSAETRLSDCASALRLGVELGARNIKLKTVRAILDHVIDRLPLSSGDLCTPLALDYAKCLRTVLSFQPHVEHLPRAVWERVADFCIRMIQDAGSTPDDETVVAGAEQVSTMNGQSYRSSRSHFNESAGSQSNRNLSINVTYEMVISLSLLTASPNAPLSSRAESLLWGVIDFLKANSAPGRSHQAAFATLNHMLAWTRTDNIRLTQTATNHVIRLVRHFWPQKSPGLHDAMLITLQYLRPYILAGVRRHDGSTLLEEVRSLLDVLRRKHTTRLERQLLLLDDVRLAGRTDALGSMPTIRLGTLSLCSGDSRAEYNWVLVDLLAFLSGLRLDSEQGSLASDDDADDAFQVRPRKRQRLTDELEELLHKTTSLQDSAGSDATISRVVALQTVLFMTQQNPFNETRLANMVDRLCTSSTNENGTIAAWALLALSGCASQLQATATSLTARWNAVWLLAVRSMSNVSSCRAACHLLDILMRVRLASQTSIQELVNIVTSSIDVSGPSTLADSVLHLLTAVGLESQRYSPAAAIGTAESILGWLFRTFMPSRLGDRTYSASQWTHDAGDITRLIATCVNHKTHTHVTATFPQWESVAQASLACQEQQALVSYLLLLPQEPVAGNPELFDAATISGSPAFTTARTSCEALVLTHLTSEVLRTHELWIQWQKERSKIITSETIKSLLTSCCIVSCTALCNTFSDTRKQAQLQRHLGNLLDAIRDFASGPQCDQDKYDAILLTVSQTCTGLFENAQDGDWMPTACEKALCGCCSGAISARQQNTSLGDDDQDDDMMSIDDRYDSQDSRKSVGVPVTRELSSDLTLACSPYSLRSEVGLYIQFIALVSTEDSSGADHPDVSEHITDYILTLSDADLLTGRRVISDMPRLGLLLRSEDTDRLFDRFTDSVLPSYTYERSEVATGAVLDVMNSLTTVWTNASKVSLFDLGIDIYKWYTTTAMDSGVLSARAQQKLATLLLKLFQVDTDYGSDGEDSSVRTNLFRLLEIGSITVQHHIANRISSIFGLFVLAQHDALFGDLQQQLPADADWVEGLAMRSLLLSRLASAWHSLLRQCVYYLFETAARVKSSQRYVGHCLLELSMSLKFRSPQRLFQLFAPQLLHTWLETQSIAGLPFAAFQYPSLERMLEHNKSEIVGQLVMRVKPDDLKMVAIALKLSEVELAQSCFAKCLAYAISWDVSTSTSNGNVPVSERYLRTLTKDKETYMSLIIESFPAVMGHIYLSMQQDDVADTWMKDDPLWVPASSALSEIRGYSHSDRKLPPSQQPSFKSRALCDQIERLCRRTVHKPDSPWTAGSFALTARMLLDSLDDALGPLHACLVLRKLRALVSMAGSIAVSSLPLEMLIHSIRPYLSDSQCADDALGLLRYLLSHGKTYFQSSNLLFVNSQVSLMVLQMRAHSGSHQDSTTQETQHRHTLQKMEDFHAWLIKYLQDCHSGSKKRRVMCNMLIKPLEMIRLPGNAHRGSAESSLLLLLLDQSVSPDAFISPTVCLEAIDVLSENFEPPSSVDEDCLGTDVDAAKYALSLWRLLNAMSPQDTFTAWAANVMGRAYASTGVRHQRGSTTDESLGGTSSVAEGVAQSQAMIVRRMSALMLSTDRKEISLADYTLRKVVSTFGSGEAALAFEQLLPASLALAVTEGTFTYQPRTVEDCATTPVDRRYLQEALQIEVLVVDDDWYKHLAVSTCRWASRASILPALPAVLYAVPDLARELLPAIFHILLVDGQETEQILRTELSRSMNAHLANEEPALFGRRQFFLKLFMYLRSQPLVGESTMVDRLQWLDIDLLAAANAAALCHMPTTALLLAESASAPVQTNRRASSRASLSQPSYIQVPDDVLLSIFKQVEECDSFYGVQQPASLDSILNRLDFEGDGFSSLMFRTARLDSSMRGLLQPSQEDSMGVVRSLTALNLNSITYALLSSPLGDIAQSSSSLMSTALKLQQWNVATPETLSGEILTSFTVYQQLNRATEVAQIRRSLRSGHLALLHSQMGMQGSTRPAVSWWTAMAALSEIGEIFDSASEAAVSSTWDRMQRRQSWMHMAQYEDSHALFSNRQTLFSALVHNRPLSNALHIGAKLTKRIEIESALRVSEHARDHGASQEALTAAAQVTGMARECATLGLATSAAAANETATVLWEIGEKSASVDMLRLILTPADSETQDIPVGRSGILAQLARQLASARLEKPDEILERCLKPAIANLKDRSGGTEAGIVFHEFASFCDQQLQNPGYLEDFERAAKLREKKLLEKQELEAMEKNATRTKMSTVEIAALNKLSRTAKKWFDLDDQLYEGMKRARETYVQQSLQNHLLALRASDQHDISVLRFFALWLEHVDVDAANVVASKYLPSVPVWKFVVLINQLMSRLENNDTGFQVALRSLVQRICAEHPHHSLHQLFAATRISANKEGAAHSRCEAAAKIRRALETSGSSVAQLIVYTYKANNLYHRFAMRQQDKFQNGPGVDGYTESRNLVNDIPQWHVPPATISVTLSRDSKYDTVPTIVKFSNKIKFMTGQSAPKVLTAYASDGQEYKQLFKGSDNDDLRQDAIMEQVFEEVSKMLRSHKATRQRDLMVRTYKVIPLTPKSGIIEFVPHSMPLNDYLVPAHSRYYPQCLKGSTARSKIHALASHSTDARIKEYRKICDAIPPVLRYFFLERFSEPDVWFRKRTAYTRTTAAASMLGHVIGLGDRHCSNIMLDEESGEVVHIDLGIAFEAGRVLTIPELVPFRLSRDIVDGMGITKVEGVFRRCCEFTMDALREDKDSIMTLLNVLRYDPLHSWTISPLRAKRMQDAQDTGMKNPAMAAKDPTTRTQEHDMGEADRALSVVEKKLSKTLSTAATVNELIQQASDEKNLATIFSGWSAFY